MEQDSQVRWQLGGGGGGGGGGHRDPPCKTEPTCMQHLHGSHKSEEDGSKHLGLSSGSGSCKIVPSMLPRSPFCKPDGGESKQRNLLQDRANMDAMLPLTAATDLREVAANMGDPHRNLAAAKQSHD